MPFCSQKFLFMVLEEISSDETISRNLSPDRLYCGVVCDCTTMKYILFF